MAEICGVMHGGKTQPHDDHGCILPMHGGADQTHEFIDRDGQHWLWEVDLSCTCEHCMRCEGDYCTTYWRKPDGHGDAEYDSWVPVAAGVLGTFNDQQEQPE